MRSLALQVWNTIVGLVALAILLLVVGVVVLVVWGQVSYWWRTEGPASPHWGQQFICTEYKTVLINKFDGTEDECVAGYWKS